MTLVSVQYQKMLSDPADIQRKFVKPSSISECLKCSICLQVFSIPTRLFCGHTFCQSCIQAYLKKGKNCPNCRTPVDVKKVGMDLLAMNLISELEVFCIHEDCSWKGELSLLEIHLEHQCFFQEQSKSGINKHKHKKPTFEQVDEQITQRINQNINKGSLISRVMMNNSSLRNKNEMDITRKLLKTQTAPQLIGEYNPEKNKKKDKNTQDDFDFLMELYD